MSKSLILSAIEGEILPEEQTYQASLRAAIFDGVSQSDVADVVKSIVAKAKTGDVAAQRMMFDYVLGGKTKPTQINVTNHFGSVEEAARVRRAQ